MKRHHLLSLLLTGALSCNVLAADVGVSIRVGEPGFYGSIDIGNFPRPAVIYPEPVVIRPATVPVSPLYLRVPPGHAKKWARYCGRYNACSRPVYFVQDEWYQREYVPYYQEHHPQPEYREPERRDERGQGRGRDHDRGHGHERGHGRD